MLAKHEIRVQFPLLALGSAEADPKLAILKSV